MFANITKYVHSCATHYHLNWSNWFHIFFRISHDTHIIFFKKHGVEIPSIVQFHCYQSAIIIMRFFADSNKNYCYHTPYRKKAIQTTSHWNLNICIIRNFRILFSSNNSKFEIDCHMKRVHCNNNFTCISLQFALIIIVLKHFPSWFGLYEKIL